MSCVYYYHRKKKKKKANKTYSCQKLNYALLIYSSLTQKHLFPKTFLYTKPRQNGCHSNIFNNFGQNFNTKMPQISFGKVMESPVSWKKCDS